MDLTLKTRFGKRCPHQDRKIICGNNSIPCHYCLGASHGTYRRDWIYAGFHHRSKRVIELGGRPWDEVMR